MSNNKSIVDDNEYKKFLIELKEKVKNSQLKAAVKVNYELLDLYWNLGKEITEKQVKYSWGEAFIPNLSKDLKNEFPNMKGFSIQNLKNIRYWYLFYSRYLIGLQAVSQLKNIESKIKSIPWGHNQRIMYKCKNIEDALFYIDKTIENGWSRNDVVAEYSLASISQPIRISKYKINKFLNTEYKNNLPSIEEIEEGIKSISIKKKIN